MTIWFNGNGGSEVATVAIGRVGAAFVTDWSLVDVMESSPHFQAGLEDLVEYLHFVSL